MGKRFGIVQVTAARNAALVVLALALVVGSLSGCASKEPVVERDSVCVSITGIGNTLDAAVANWLNTTIASSHIYDWIIAADEEFGFEPAVATSWEYVDNLTFKFTVGEGYVFHNGEPLELEDVVFSVERLMDIPQRANIMSNVDSVEVTDEREITIKLKEPNSSTIPSVMAVAQVYNKAYCERVGESYANSPIGTGPYKVANFIPGDKLELTVWEEYPFEKPKIKNITFKSIEEAASRYISVETGEAQFAAISYRDVDRAEENDKLTVVTMDSTNTAFISMNTKKAPFDNTNVRLAMAYATDKQGLAEVQGGAKVIQSMTPPMFSCYYESPDVPDFDLEKAKALLEAEGYNESNPLKFEAWIYGGSSSIMEAYQATLRNIGVQMSIRNLEFGVFLEGVAGGEYVMLSGSWNNTTGDPLSSIENYWSGSFGSRNISFFENARCDELYAQAKAATDEETINACVREVEDIVAAEMPIIPTFSNMGIFVMDKQLKGVRIYPSNMYSFRGAYFE